MNRFVSNLILGIFILALVVVYGVAKQPAIYSLTSPAVREGERQAVLPDGSILNVAVADSEGERIQGLSGIQQLSRDEGMLFVFPYSGQHGIWMEDMNFALDILWLDEEGTVVDMIESAPVPSADDEKLPIYHNVDPAKYVLEAAAGTVRTAGIEVGERVILS